MAQLRIRTEYDFPHLEELQRVSAKAFAPKETRRRRILLSLLGGLSVVSGAVMLSTGLALPGAISLVVGAPLLGMGVFLMQYRAWLSARSMGTGEHMVVADYVIEKANILAYVGQDSQRYPYSNCEYLMEAELSLYLFLKDARGLMLDKAGVKGGSADELRALLEEKTGLTTQWMGRSPR